MINILSFFGLIVGFCLLPFVLSYGCFRLKKNKADDVDYFLFIVSSVSLCIPICTLWWVVLPSYLLIHLCYILHQKYLIKLWPLLEKIYELYKTEQSG